MVYQNWKKKEIISIMYLFICILSFPSFLHRIRKRSLLMLMLMLMREWTRNADIWMKITKCKVLCDASVVATATATVTATTTTTIKIIYRIWCHGYLMRFFTSLSFTSILANETHVKYLKWTDNGQLATIVHSFFLILLHIIVQVSEDTFHLAMRI